MGIQNNSVFPCPFCSQWILIQIPYFTNNEINQIFNSHFVFKKMSSSWTLTSVLRHSTSPLLQHASWLAAFPSSFAVRCGCAVFMAQWQRERRGRGWLLLSGCLQSLYWTSSHPSSAEDVTETVEIKLALILFLKLAAQLPNWPLHCHTAWDKSEGTGKGGAGRRHGGRKERRGREELTGSLRFWGYLSLDHVPTLCLHLFEYFQCT